MKQIILAVIFIAQSAVATEGQTPTPTPTNALTPPVRPTYQQCYQSNWIACNQANVDARNNYNEQVRVYNIAVAEQNAAAQVQTSEQAQLANTQSQATLDSINTAQEKNKSGGQIYKIASMACYATSAVYAAKFAASCSGGATCVYPHLYKSMAFAAFGMMASKQAASHNRVAHTACLTANQVSTTQTNCGPSPDDGGTTFPPTGGTEVLPVDNSGNCTGTFEECNALIASLPPGTNLRDASGGLSQFATNPPFKANPDGSFTTKDGKKIAANVFTDPAAMTSQLGMSPAAAKALMADLNRAGQGSVSLTGKAEDPTVKSAGSSLGGYDVSGSGMNIAVKADEKNGDAKNVGKDIGGGEVATRDIASAEGLVRDFNGEQIGVAGDDIFKMMNRRYNLKAVQDSFIVNGGK